MKVKRLVFIGAGTLVLVVILFFIITSKIIGDEVNKLCFIAKEKYPGDCTEALSSFLDDDKNDFRSRNSAVWALGQLGDKKALPVLEKYYIADISKKESLFNSLSQYELKKAINLANGNLNITHIVWRK